MPYAGSVYTLPASYLAVSGETIEAQQHNDPFEDIAQTLNEARPIGVGGTGASTAVGAADNFSTKGSNVASAATTDIGAASGRFVHITGTTTITGLGTKTAGVVRVLTFDDALILTHHSTSLILPAGANITTAAGDSAVMVSEGSGNWRCVAYQRANGTAIALPTDPSITGNLTQTSTDAGASGAPVHDLYRNSATPAASDNIGVRRWTGEDSAGNTETYAEDVAVILDPTSGSEDAKLVRRTVVAGTLADRLHVGAGAWMEGATGGDPGVGKINATQVQANGAVLGVTSGTAQATTSGTSIDFTSIPAWVKRITLLMSGISTNGTSNLLIQIGDSGGVENTGYVGSSNFVLGNVSSGSDTSTAGALFASNSAANVLYGKIDIELLDGTTWMMTGALARPSGGGGGYYAQYSKALSGTLDRVRLTTVNGTDAFDAGSVNILYE